LAGECPVASLGGYRNPGKDARCDRGVEIRDLARVLRVTDIEHPQARDTHRAGDDPWVDGPRDIAIVARVAAGRVIRAGVPADLVEVFRLVDLKAQIGGHARLRLVVDVY
jgi:hypothetical protein